MEVDLTTTSSPRCSPSRRHQEGCDHNPTPDKVMGSRVTKRRASWQSVTASDPKRPRFTKGHIPRSMNQFLDSPSYPPNAIVRRMTACTQAASNLETRAKPGGPNPTDLRFAGNSLARSHQSDFALIDSESCKDVLKRGLMSMTDDAIQQATMAKQASRETSRIRVILRAWEIEEAERYAELLRLLQRTNTDMSNDEASWFEKFLSDRSLPELQDDLNLSLTSYRNDSASFAKSDELLDQLENYARDRNLIISKEEFARNLKALIVDRDECDSQESDSDESTYNSNASDYF